MAFCYDRDMKTAASEESGVVNPLYAEDNEHFLPRFSSRTAGDGFHFESQYEAKIKSIDSRSNESRTLRTKRGRSMDKRKWKTQLGSKRDRMWYRDRDAEHIRDHIEDAQWYLNDDRLMRQKCPWYVDAELEFYFEETVEAINNQMDDVAHLISLYAWENMYRYQPANHGWGDDGPEFETRRYHHSWHKPMNYYGRDYTLDRWWYDPMYDYDDFYDSYGGETWDDLEDPSFDPAGIYLDGSPIRLSDFDRIEDDAQTWEIIDEVLEESEFPPMPRFSSPNSGLGVKSLGQLLRAFKAGEQDDTDRQVANARKDLKAPRRRTTWKKRFASRQDRLKHRTKRSLGRDEANEIDLMRIMLGDPQTPMYN